MQLRCQIDNNEAATDGATGTVGIDEHAGDACGSLSNVPQIDYQRPGPAGYHRIEQDLTQVGHPRLVEYHRRRHDDAITTGIADPARRA